MSPAARPGDIQLRYAAILERCSRSGFLLLVLAFGAYLSGMLPSRVPPAQAAALWGRPAPEFLRATGSARGWDWIASLRDGDMACLLGIAVLASASVPALVAILPALQRQGDRLLAAICALEVAVIVLAASGILVSRG